MRKLRNKILAKFDIHINSFYVGLVIATYVAVSLIYSPVWLGFTMLAIVLHYKIK